MLSRHIEKVSAFLTAYGWQFQVKQEQIVTGFRGELKNYPISITFSPTILRICVNPLLVSEQYLGDHHHLHKLVGNLNRELRLAYLVVLDQQINLNLDILMSSLNYDDFSMLLGIVGYYCDELVGEVFDCFESSHLFHGANALIC